MNIIETKNLTKDYGHGRGIFDLSLQVEKGECYGFLGPNGAGKTTAIRHLMGFSKPQRGTAGILSLDCWKDADLLKNYIGYLPGEIVFPSGMRGSQFLHMMKKMRHMKNMDYCKTLVKRFELDPDMPIEKMSLGLKRKLAVITAFMHDPDILILDEPTSGLDPMMQQIFIDYIRDEKHRGKTILLSSHIFHEVDATCDRISIIKDGRIAAVFHTDELKQAKHSIFYAEFFTKEDYDIFVSGDYSFTAKNPQKLRARVVADQDGLNKLINGLARLHVKDMQEIPFTLEDYFMQFYKDDSTFREVDE